MRGARREHRYDENVIKNKYIGQTLHGDGIYVTIYWTSDGCDGQVDLKLHLSVGQVILFPYFDHCRIYLARWPGNGEELMIHAKVER